MTRGTRNSPPRIAGLRQHLAPLDASVWHVCDEPRCGIAQHRPIYVFRHLDDTYPDRLFGSGCIHQLYVMRSGMCHGNGIRLDDASTSNCRHRVKILPRELRVLCVDRFRNWDHVIDGCVRHGATPLAGLHVGELLQKIRNR